MGVRLSTWAIAKKNIRRRPGRSFCLILAVLLFSFALFSGTVFSVSLSRGAKSAGDRLGADVIVVPEGFDPHIDGVILSGKPSMFYLPADILDRLKSIDGIDRASPQTFLATLRASCCSYPLQIVGVDYETDFIVRPWLESSLGRPLRDGELIVGFRVNGEVGDELHFFGRDLPIAGKLEQTGMGFDSTVFVTRATVTDLAKAAENIFDHPLSSDRSRVSTVMLKLKPGFDSVAVARQINAKLGDDGVFALFSKKYVNTIASSLTLFSRLIAGGILTVWVLAVGVIALLFSLSLAERRAEFGVLRAIGATRRKIFALALVEAALVSLDGALLGLGLGTVAVAVLSPSIGAALKMPFLLPSWPEVFALALLATFAAVLTGLFGVFFTARRAARSNIYETMREA